MTGGWTEAVRRVRRARLRVDASTLADYISLTKPRITCLVVTTTAAGFWVASRGAPDLGLLFHTLLATALVAGGTSAMNQVLERDVDGLMARTRNRPLPDGRISAAPAGIFAGGLAAAGIVYLALAANLLTAVLAAISFAVYDLAYTPLKRVHPISTLVGAVPGALPIAGGWTAVRGELGAGGLALFGILFFWQMPHFLSLAWILREDYRRAGLAMLTVDDPDGRATRHRTLTYTLTLLPVSLLPAVLGLAGGIFFWGALVLGVLFLAGAAAFAADLGQASARRLFRYSVLYLPLLLALLALDTA